MSEMAFRDGSNPNRAPEERILEIERAVHTTEGDLLAAGFSQRTRILERTGAGVDVDGAPFAQYDTTRPYYYRPWDRPGLGRKGSSLGERRSLLSDSARQRSTARFFKRIGGSLRTGELKFKGEVIDSIHGRERDTIKFASYDAFKRALGRTNVDLMGPRAPHMLQAIEIRSGGSHLGGTEAPVYEGSPDEANELVMGIYGEKAAIAQGHNTGDGTNKRRRFFGANDFDAKAMLLEIYSHIALRLKNKQ
jgi:hypothetical protein